MFEIIDLCGTIWPCYGTFIDEDGDIQFIIEYSDGTIGRTNASDGFYKIYHKEEMFNV